MAPSGPARALAALLLLGLAGPAPAQDAPGAAVGGLALGRVQSPVLVIDVERLLAETLYGRRLAADQLARTEALAAENRRIEAELTAEVERLTERRASMDPEAFRVEADGFDARVQRIRAEQDGKEEDLATALAAGRAAFIDAATPVLARLMADSGAAVILERRDVFLSVSVVDVTDAAIAAIDAALGDGAPEEGAPEEGAPENAAPGDEPAPDAAPAPAGPAVEGGG